MTPQPECADTPEPTTAANEAASMPETTLCRVCLAEILTEEQARAHVDDHLAQLIGVRHSDVLSDALEHLWVDAPGRRTEIEIACQDLGLITGRDEESVDE